MRLSAQAPARPIWPHLRMSPSGPRLSSGFQVVPTQPPSRDGGWVGTTWKPELKRGPEGDIRKWGQMGLAGAWADKRIQVYGYSLRYATALEFSQKVLQRSEERRVGKE